jgi:hypothetical protein
MAAGELYAIDEVFRAVDAAQMARCRIDRSTVLAAYFTG